MREVFNERLSLHFGRASCPFGCVLFNTVFRSMGYRVSNGRMGSEQHIGKYVEGSIIMLFEVGLLLSAIA